MKKAITFKEFKAVQRMPLNTFNRWVSSIYMSGVQDGLKEGEKGTGRMLYIHNR